MLRLLRSTTAMSRVSSFYLQGVQKYLFHLMKKSGERLISGLYENKGRPACGEILALYLHASLQVLQQNIHFHETLLVSWKLFTHNCTEAKVRPLSYQE